MLRLDQIHKNYGAVRAVRGISLEVPRGQIVGILGPNGAGKTTTVRMIAGTLPPSRGTVAVDGFDTLAQTRQARQRIGYLPEGTPLYPEMRVASYLRYRTKLFGLPRGVQRTATERAIERCWLTEMRTRRIGTLSKGYKQRVGLASALLHSPPLLILDEPTSGLDPAQIAQTRKLMRELAGDHTMLVISHILPEVERACDRIVIISAGTIRADGSPADLIRHAAGSGTVLAVCKANPDTLAQIPGLNIKKTNKMDDGWTAFECEGESVPAETLRERIGAACAAQGTAIRELRTVGGSLEEVYIGLIEQSNRDDAEGAP